MTDLRERLAAAKCVLFDFDGPVCRLFAGVGAPAVAAAIAERLSGRLEHGALRPKGKAAGDPLALLLAAWKQGESKAVVKEAESTLTAQEIRAATSAHSTAYANSLILALSAAGFRLAVTTNNSPKAVAAYLRREGLDGCFGEHIHGRTADLALLKPHPHCLERALDSTGSSPAETLMIGDSPADWIAADAIGVSFLGYAPDGAKVAQLADAGVKDIVRSLEPLYDAVGSGLRAE
ncbi:HAD family hydrolase [Streptomyces sp. ERV7]|uniref:HAD family hydrolase n=1 Tax=Streptomyces sp. ERV7 TaxID=1322334 RepID=UPI0018FE3553|nr:HAD family hydrolase [Streptomyces sp. ERV7]